MEYEEDKILQNIFEAINAGNFVVASYLIKNVADSDKNYGGRNYIGACLQYMHRIGEQKTDGKMEKYDECRKFIEACIGFGTSVDACVGGKSAITYVLECNLDDENPRRRLPLPKQVELLDLFMDKSILWTDMKFRGVVLQMVLDNMRMEPLLDFIKERTGESVWLISGKQLIQMDMNGRKLHESSPRLGEIMSLQFKKDNLVVVGNVAQPAGAQDRTPRDRLIYDTIGACVKKVITRDMFSGLNIVGVNARGEPMETITDWTPDQFYGVRKTYFGKTFIWEFSVVDRLGNICFSIKLDDNNVPLRKAFELYGIDDCLKPGAGINSLKMIANSENIIFPMKFRITKSGEIVHFVRQEKKSDIMFAKYPHEGDKFIYRGIVYDLDGCSLGEYVPNSIMSPRSGFGEFINQRYIVKVRDDTNIISVTDRRTGASFQLIGIVGKYDMNFFVQGDEGKYLWINYKSKRKVGGEEITFLVRWDLEKRQCLKIFGEKLRERGILHLDEETSIVEMPIGWLDNMIFESTVMKKPEQQLIVNSEAEGGGEPQHVPGKMYDGRKETPAGF